MIIHLTNAAFGIITEDYANKLCCVFFLNNTFWLLPCYFLHCFLLSIQVFQILIYINGYLSNVLSFVDVPDSKNFDVTLMIALLRNLTKCSPLCGYDRLPCAIDTTPAADLARIKHYRNYMAHLNDGKLDSVDFNANWNDITNVCNSIQLFVCPSFMSLCHTNSFSFHACSFELNLAVMLMFVSFFCLHRRRHLSKISDSRTIT